MKNKRKIELLAPARNADIAIAAIDHGADAVYMGASHHGARSQAGNSLNDIKRVVDYAHRFNVRVYITLNTLVYDSELEEVKSLVWNLYHAGVDALIVQDMSLLEMDLPPIALHASTQCDIRTPEKARFLQDAGFSQLVLARELTLDEIRAIRKETTVPLEAFVHGALCVSYSGNCQASYLLTGRSANRGECAQMCRLPYNLIDGNGNIIMKGAHLLSLKDMNRIDSLSEMIEAGIDSFKIEGRLKDIEYIKTVVAAYRTELDRIIEAHPDRLERSSAGKSEFSFTPSLKESFNRGYTEYFLKQRRPQVSMATFETPKSIGAAVGTVTRCDGKTLTVKSKETFHNGDGFSYKAADGTMQGFRINRAEGNRLLLNSPLNIPAGTTLYRNQNNAYSAILKQRTAVRKIPVEMILRLSDNDTIALDIAITELRNCTATASLKLEQIEKSNKPQEETRKRTLGKLGDTPYSLEDYNDTVGDIFIPLSLLSTLKRDAVTALERARKAAYRFEYRRKSENPTFYRGSLLYNDNVANKLSRAFYSKAGVKEIEESLETSGHCNTRRRVMKTRYCLRRELGKCLKTPQGKTLAGPLSLKGANFVLDLEFDCNKCEMSIYTSGIRK